MVIRMKSRILTSFLVSAGVLSAAGPAVAQSEVIEGLRGDMIADISSVEGKYLALADAVPASDYGWRPMEGVRSVGEVYCHVAGANYLIPRFFGVEQPPEAETVEQACNSDELESLKSGVIEALQASFAHARLAIAAVPDSALDDPTKLFGSDTTKRAAMLLFVTHMHEHLGQSVAYARANGVVPPWSAGN